MLQKGDKMKLINAGEYNKQKVTQIMTQETPSYWSTTGNDQKTTTLTPNMMTERKGTQEEKGTSPVTAQRFAFKSDMITRPKLQRKSSQQTHRPNLITSQAHHSIHQKWWKKSFEFVWIFKPANTHTARVINAAASISKCAIMWRCLMKTIHVINAINHDKSLRSNKCLQLVWHVFVFFFFRIFFIIALGRCPNRSSLVLFLHFPVIFLSLSGFAITFSLSETN